MKKKHLKEIRTLLDDYSQRCKTEISLLKGVFAINKRGGGGTPTVPLKRLHEAL